MSALPTAYPHFKDAVAGHVNVQELKTAAAALKILEERSGHSGEVHAIWGSFWPSYNEGLLRAIKAGGTDDILILARGTTRFARRA